MAKHRNGAIDEVIAACNLRRGVFRDLIAERVSQIHVLTVDRPAF